MSRQWIPGCGVLLITGQDPPDTNKKLSPTEFDAKLPHITIFTEFGDLNLQQKVTIFKRYINHFHYYKVLFKIKCIVIVIYFSGLSHGQNLNSVHLE